jgi:transglutaminase-like putative cysteine protease/predicted glutamine amidotransferase
MLSMTNFFSLSFDNAASPSLRLKAQADPETENDWGMVWYSGDEGPATKVKSSGNGDEELNRLLSDWNRFRSASFFAMSGERQHGKNPPPYLRSYGGRQFVFVFSAVLKGDFQAQLPLGGDPSFEPLSSAATEHAFCWLLHKLFENQSRKLSGVPPKDLQRWLGEINALGEFNCVISDGNNQVAYRDREGRGSLFGLRRIPPHTHTHLENDALTMDLGDAMDANRSVYLFATQPLSSEDWQAIEPGSMLAVRRGRVLYDSTGAALRPSTTPMWSGVGLQAQWNSQPAAPAAPPQAPPLPRVLNVLHETAYHYRLPVERSSHLFRLRPLQDRLQELLDYSCEITVDGRSREFEDVFGNATMQLEVDRPFTELIVRSRSKLLLRPAPARWMESRAFQREKLPQLWMPWQRQMMLPYLLPPELPETELKQLTDYAMGFAQRNDFDLLDTLMDLNQTIKEDYVYAGGFTNNFTTPFDVYSTRRGVCQDFANLFICLARLLNIPARYRVGYIYTGGNYENKVQSEASHAWAELYLPTPGWIGFDPTNGCVTGPDHVRVACGRNYLDATPTSGTIFKGGGPESLSVSVRVEQESTDTGNGGWVVPPA